MQEESSPGLNPRAMALLQEGEQKLKPGFIAKLIWGNSFDEAADCFTKAGNLLKNDKNWNEAAKAYLKATEAHMSAKSLSEAVTSLANAAFCFRKKASPQDAIGCFERAIDILTDEGRFSAAAKHHKELAEIYENELGDRKRASIHYNRAIELYEGEPNSSSNVKPCLIKVAHFAADEKDFNLATELFEKLASISMANKLSAYGAKEYFLKAGLCTLAAGDVIAAQKALDRYRDMHPAFERDREFTLLSNVTTAMENYDLELFMKTITDYDGLSKIEPFLTTLLLQIRKMIANDDEVTKEADDEEESAEGDSALI